MREWESALSLSGTGASTYFSRSRKGATDADGVFTSTFTLDTRMRWSIRGRPSPLLTRWIEYGISTYMRHPRVQSLVMLPVPPLRSLLNIQPLFETIPSLGSVIFTYRITGLSVTIEVHFNLTAPSPMTVCILNGLFRVMVHRRMGQGTCHISTPRLEKSQTHAGFGCRSNASYQVFHEPTVHQSPIHHVPGQGTDRGCLLGRFLY